MTNPIPYGDAPVAARITSPGRAIVAAQVSVAQTEFPATVQVGTVTELHPRQSPTVTNSGTSEAAVLDFGLPRAWGIGVRSTTTLEPGSDATVTKVEQGNNVLLDFGIPKGEKGDTGDPGADATAIYGDPVTVDKGGTGASNGNRLAYYCHCTQTVTDTTSTLTGEIEGYQDAIGNVIFIRAQSIGSNKRPTTLVITSGGETVATYNLKMGGRANGGVAVGSTPELRNRFAFGVVISEDGTATAIQQPHTQDSLVAVHGPISTFSNPTVYENLTAAGSYTSDNYTAATYAISNACTNLVSSLSSDVFAIRPKYFDIVIRKRAIWLRYCDSIASAAISSGGHYTLSQSTLRPIFDDLGEINKFMRQMRYIGTLTYTVVETGEAGSQTFELAEGESAQIGSTTATLDLSMVGTTEARITFTDEDTALSDVKISKYWAFPLTQMDTTAYLETSSTGITITRDGGWCQAALDVEVSLDTLTTSTTFSIPRGFIPKHPVSAWAVTSGGGMVELRAEKTSLAAGTLTVSLAPNTTLSSGTLRASLIWPCEKPSI